MSDARQRCVVVNPDTIAQQVEGGTIFGLTAALHGAIPIKDGRVEQSNFDSYLPMRIDEVLVVETHLVKSTEAPGGIGEPPTAAGRRRVTRVQTRSDAMETSARIDVKQR